MEGAFKIEVRKSTLAEILPLRHQFLQAINCQIRYDSCHIRHWADEYLLILDGKKVGYGSTNILFRQRK